MALRRNLCARGRAKPVCYFESWAAATAFAAGGRAVSLLGGKYFGWAFTRHLRTFLKRGNRGNSAKGAITGVLHERQETVLSDRKIAVPNRRWWRRTSH